MQSYGALADVYDLLTQDVDYEQWAQYYMEIFKKLNMELPKNAYIADVACGSGTLSLEFARRGYEVVGIDNAEAMIGKAAQKAREQGIKAVFTLQDMRSFELPRKADLVVCSLDGLNYLTGEGDADSFFSAARSQLKTGGFFIFDINTQYKLMNSINGNQFYDDREDLCCLWSGRYNDTIPAVTMELTLFVKEGGLFRRFDEEHTERIYTAEELVDKLKNAGFEVVALFDELSFNPPSETSMRVHFIAQKCNSTNKG
ncbi:MAG: class I SAM-dependent DNA methyltransferase [Christensenellales bacterium]